MNFLRSCFCRSYQTGFRAALPVLPYREPTILHVTAEVADVCKEKGISSVLVVTDPGIAELGLPDPMVAHLKESGVARAVYAYTVANPTVSNVEAARQMYLDAGCQAIIGFAAGRPWTARRAWQRASPSRSRASRRCAAC